MNNSLISFQPVAGASALMEVSVLPSINVTLRQVLVEGVVSSVSTHSSIALTMSLVAETRGELSIALTVYDMKDITHDIMTVWYGIAFCITPQRPALRVLLFICCC